MKKEIIIVIAIIILGFLSLIGILFKPQQEHATIEDGKAAQVIQSKQIALITISGPISDGDGGGSLLNPGSSLQTVMQNLRTVKENSKYKAVIVRINSPGGTVGMSQEIYEELKAIRAKGKVVVVSAGDIMASGGYYIACGADKIVANPGSLVGSIGVIIESVSVAEGLQKLGIKPQVIKSGAHKDILNPMRDITPEEQALLQAVIDDTYDQFVTAVSDGRKMDKKAVKALADGRVFTGRQAKLNGLIDQLGGYDEALALTKKLANLPDSAGVEDFNKPSLFQGLLGATTNQFTHGIIKELSPYSTKILMKSNI